MSTVYSKNLLCQVRMFMVTFPSGSVWLTDAPASKIEKEIDLQGGDEALARAELRDDPVGHFFFRVSGGMEASCLIEHTGLYGWNIFIQEK
jgi:hypothetical protein